MAFHECRCKKILFQNACFKLALVFIFLLFESFSGVVTKDKPLVITENSSSVKVWYHIFLYWKVYILMIAAMNFLNEDLHWFSGKKTLIDGGVYMHLNGV